MGCIIHIPNKDLEKGYIYKELQIKKKKTMKEKKSKIPERALHKIYSI